MLRRLRHDLEIGHRHGALADRGADAVGAGVPAADHDYLFAGSEDRLDLTERLVAEATVLLRQEVHGEMDSLEFASGHRQVARLLRPAGQHHSVVLLYKLIRWYIDTDVSVVVKGHALRLHLLDAPIDVNLLHLEVRDAVAQQAAGFRPALIDMHLVPDSRELLRAGEARRPRSDNRHLLACLVFRDLRLEPLRNGTVGDLAFDGFDGDRIFVDVERTGCLSRRWADATSEFREIVGRVQVASGLFPVVAIDQVVPVGNLVVDGAAGGRAGDTGHPVAIGHPAVHAARRLVADFFFRQRQHKLVPMLDALRDRLVVAVLTLEFKKTGDLTHIIPQPAS